MEIKDEHHKDILHIDTRNIMGLSKHKAGDSESKSIQYTLELLHRGVQITEDKYYELLEVLYSNKF